MRSWGRPMRTQVGLLANAEFVCEAGRPSRKGSPPECWSVKDDTLPGPPQIVGGAPFSWATRTPIAAFTDGKYSFDAFFGTGKQGVRRGVVWNVERGATVATWKPDQEGCGGIRDPWSHCKQPAAFAISAEGGFLAESKAGQLRIYRIVH